jgi:hypothetical protein
LSHACKNLNIELKICHVSLEELGRVVDYQRSVIAKVAGQIPDATAAKVKGGFYSLYREQLKVKPDATIDEIFSAFTTPMPVLVNDYKVTLIDDEWFISAEKAVETTAVANRIKNEFLKKRGRPKTHNSAMHDALMLRWIERDRRQFNRKTWIITLDASLPIYRVDDVGDGTPLAITLDAFLQWISPLALVDDANEDMATIFAEAMRYQLLPQENLFDVRDFLVFAEMEWSCKDVPAEDVESCIRYLKAQAPNLDPTKPEDREKISHEISKFFADPGRKYKRAVQEAEAFALRVSEEADAKMQKVSQESEKELSGLKQQIESQLKTIAERDQALIDMQENERRNQLRQSAVGRLFLLCLLLLALEFGVGYGASRYAEGSGLFQKLWNSKEWLALGFVVTIFVSWFFLGKDRIRALGWSFAKLLGGDT